ncbi:MAG: hypothetical protein PHI27_06590 [Eubacteriales bacterium]|nr:hypothetical protein [Eubacteriales bacterium]MDD4513741.1 hypothetical protein [Eubacteriales bacterium]
MCARKESDIEARGEIVTPYMTKNELANIAGYTYRRLHEIDKSLPDDDKLFVRGNDGKYDLAMFVRRWVKYNVDKETGDSNSLDEVKAIHEKVKTRKTELEVAKMEGVLVDMTDVRRLWGDVAHTVMQNMVRLPSTLAPQLVMMENIEIIAGVIERAIHEVLTAIAETPVPSYAASADENEESEE